MLLKKYLQIFVVILLLVYYQNSYFSTFYIDKLEFTSELENWIEMFLKQVAYYILHIYLSVQILRLLERNLCQLDYYADIHWEIPGCLLPHQD